VSVQGRGKGWVDAKGGGGNGFPEMERKLRRTLPIEPSRGRWFGLQAEMM